ncbi:MAG: hypothetical protein J5J00_07325 [Deltaproteobacteria bacterium]|nr:hypothetical protein [Deltaproteobacteria bacterium]
MTKLRPTPAGFLLLMFLLSLAACSTRPKLLPNDQLLRTKKEVVDADVNECLELAETYSGDPDKWKEVAGTTAKSAVIGSAAGAVGGAIAGSAGRGTAIGAASAAVAALLHELYSLGEHDPSYRQFAEYCLTKKGYEVAGW